MRRHALSPAAFRQRTYRGADNPFIDDAHQFEVMTVAHRHGFPVPMPIALYDAEDILGEGPASTTCVRAKSATRRRPDGATGPAARRLAEQTLSIMNFIHYTKLWQHRASR